MLVGLLALGGCARLEIPGQLKAGPLSYAFTDKTPEEYVRCWGGFGPGNNDNEPLGEGAYRLYLMNPKTYGMIRDAHPVEGGGSKIAYYTRQFGKDSCL